MKRSPGVGVAPTLATFRVNSIGMRGAQPHGVSHLVLGRFRILRSLGEGGMGVLLVAQDTATSRQAILKMPRMVCAKDVATMRRFEHEIEVLRRLRHDRIPAWLGDGTWAGRRVLALEHVEGLTVSQLVHRRGALPGSAASAVVADVLSALHATHTLAADDGAPMHLVHRDVSPQNVIVDADGHGHLIDFGVSTDARFDGGLDEGHVVGKVGYMAPEVVAGGDVGPATDQFAAGIVLWEMIAARRLFRADTERNTWKNIVRCNVPRLDCLFPPPIGVSRAIADIAARMLDADPASRFPSCAAAAAALVAALGDTTTAAAARTRLDNGDLGYARRMHMRGARTVRLRPGRDPARSDAPVRHEHAEGSNDAIVAPFADGAAAP